MLYYHIAVNTKTCKDEEFRCPLNAKCIPMSWICDEEEDCPGGSDEQHCTGNTMH